MADEQKKVTDANRRISRGDRDQKSPAQHAGSDVEEANERISRGTGQEREGTPGGEQVLKRPPD